MFIVKRQYLARTLKFSECEINFEAFEVLSAQSSVLLACVLCEMNTRPLSL